MVVLGCAGYAREVLYLMFLGMMIDVGGD